MGSIARTSTVGSAQWSADVAEVDATDGTVLLVSTDPQRAAATILNDADSTGDLYVVPTSTQRRGGVRIAPGAGLILSTVAPVYGYVLTGRATAYTVSESGVVC